MKSRKAKITHHVPRDKHRARRWEEKGNQSQVLGKIIKIWGRRKAK